MRKTYPSDISRKQFNTILPLLDSAREKTSMVIVDAQSVKNTNTAREKGYDAGKKVSGIKRHIAVDTNGLLHAVTVTTANVTNRNGTILMTKEYRTFLKGTAKVEGTPFPRQVFCN